MAETPSETETIGSARNTATFASYNKMLYFKPSPPDVYRYQQ